MSVITTLQGIIVDWGIRCFGIEHMKNRSVRALRLAEEVVEVAQTCYVPQDQLHKLIVEVYSRPPGNRTQEIGGVMVTAIALASCIDVDLEAALEIEVRRVLEKDPAAFAKRNQHKLDLGLTGAQPWWG